MVTLRLAPVAEHALLVEFGDTVDDPTSERIAALDRALAAAPQAAVRYQKEVLRILAEVTLGSGALAVIGGTVGVILGMTFFTGAPSATS